MTEPIDPQLDSARLCRLLLLSFLALTTAAPAIAFLPGLRDGEVAFVLYREPKLVVLQLLIAVLLPLFWLTTGRHVRWKELSSGLRRPGFAALTLLVLWLAITGLWVRVKENFLYELTQYGLLLSLIATLLVWNNRDSRVVEIVRAALIASLALVTLIGLLQLWVEIRWLMPINPEVGAENPSLLGYKNPTALAILGQLFLLCQELYRRRGSLRWTIGLAALLGLEVLYLVLLDSRSALLGLIGGGLFFTGLALCRSPSRRRLAGALLVALFLGVLIGSVWSMVPSTRERAKAMVGYLARPASYLESDRGTYLLNTLNMVRSNPFGVGLGDWQTHYPVYRRHNRDQAFSSTHLVRRAHSDHVQFLGEAGWLGLLLWLGALALLLAPVAWCYLRTGETPALFVATQLLALTAAMATDFFLEMPYHKFQLFLVFLLALATTPARIETPSSPTRGARAGWTLGAFFAVCSLILIPAAWDLGRGAYVAELMNEEYRLALEDPQRSESDTKRHLAAAARHGEILLRSRMHTKDRARDLVVFAHTLALLGERQRAVLLASRALALHPYAPNALRLMSMLKDTRDAHPWHDAYRHVMEEATQGFERPYPSPLR